MLRAVKALVAALQASRSSHFTPTISPGGYCEFTPKLPRRKLLLFQDF
jgi:hypothetical protein